MGGRWGLRFIKMICAGWRSITSCLSLETATTHMNSHILMFAGILPHPSRQSSELDQKEMSAKEHQDHSYSGV